MSTRILVVDDEPDLETLLVQKFRKEIRSGEYFFLFACDGVDALSVLDDNEDVGLVLCDINMPRMDGLTLLSRLQAKEGDLSTIIVSAYGDMENIRTAMNRGAFDFVTKPIDFADLETTISKTIRHVETLREARIRQSAAEKAQASLSRYFSPNLLQRLAGTTEMADLGGERREVASLFTDISGFTPLVEALDPNALAPLLNEYLVGMTDIVFAHDGTVAKIIGDALHVLFGAPGDQPDRATRAVSCALEMDAFAEAFRARWNEVGVALGPTRIGVHAGPAVVGNFGGGRFFDYSAYGDTINTAARLETANKWLGTRVCVSAQIASEADDFYGRPIGDLMLRGRAEPIRAFEPLPTDPGNGGDMEAYLKAYSLLEAGDPSAVQAFATQVGARPDDRLASFHLKRLLNGASGTRIELN